MARTIPEGIRPEHIIEAIHDLDGGVRHSFADSTHYDLLYEGRRYGNRGIGFIECHHTKPVSMLDGKSTTRIEDLALVCSNCHRMIHRTRPWMSVDELRMAIKIKGREDA